MPVWIRGTLLQPSHHSPISINFSHTFTLTYLNPNNLNFLHTSTHLHPQLSTPPHPLIQTKPKWWFLDYHALWILRLVTLSFSSYRQIIQAEGPAGPNRDYLFNLEKALLQIGEVLWIVHIISFFLLSFPFIFYFFNLFTNHSLGCKDKHVIDLANEVRRILEEEHWMLPCIVDVPLNSPIKSIENLSTLPKVLVGR